MCGSSPFVLQGAFPLNLLLSKMSTGDSFWILIMHLLGENSLPPFHRLELHSSKEPPGQVINPVPSIYLKWVNSTSIFNKAITIALMQITKASGTAWCSGWRDFSIFSQILEAGFPHGCTRAEESQVMGNLWEMDCANGTEGRGLYTVFSSSLQLPTWWGFHWLQRASEQALKVGCLASLCNCVVVVVVEQEAHFL